MIRINALNLFKFRTISYSYDIFNVATEMHILLPGIIRFEVDFFGQENTTRQKMKMSMYKIRMNKVASTKIKLHLM